MIKLLLALFTTSVLYGKSEKYYNDLYAKSINGKTEVKKYYKLGTQKRFVIIDIETASEVIECGLDKRSSLDSIQQVLFFAFLTGKKPVVVIYDTDGKQGIYEYRIQSLSISRHRI